MRLVNTTFKKYFKLVLIDSDVEILLSGDFSVSHTLKYK